MNELNKNVFDEPGLNKIIEIYTKENTVDAKIMVSLAYEALRLRGAIESVSVSRMADEEPKLKQFCEIMLKGGA